MIDKPGAYKISMDEYRAKGACICPPLSRDTIKDLVFRSPYHGWWDHPDLNPDYQPDEGTGKFDIGTASHSILLEGIDNVAVIEADDWRTKAAKEARDQARADGKIPLLAYQYEKVKVCVQRAEMQIYGCPELGIKNLREYGDPELSLFWKEEDTWLRARPDWISKDRKLIIDCKFTELSVNPATLDRYIINMALPLQAALYSRGAEAIFGIKPHFILVFCEIAEPYACSFVGLSPSLMEIGRQQAEYGKHIWQKCLRENTWPSYPNQVCWIEAPPWALTSWEDTASMLGEGK